LRTLPELKSSSITHSFYVLPCLDRPDGQGNTFNAAAG
jgi:hypothetical protein